MRTSKCHALVFGPAYLDYVIRIAEPLADRPIDLGCEGHLEPEAIDRLEIVCPNGASLVIAKLEGTPCPRGRLRATNDVLPSGQHRRFDAVEAIEDLGGMGAGYAAAIGGRLISAVARRGDPLSARVREAIARQGIEHMPVTVESCPQADTTIIVTSGEHGDKLPIGLRGCHASLSSAVMPDYEPAQIVVAASLPNALMHAVLANSRDSVRVLAPSARNCRDRAFPAGRIAAVTDLLALNAGEWAELGDDDRRAFEDSAAILSVTRGPEGAEISWRNDHGERARHVEPAFPRAIPPVDTNRAGEAFAAHLILSLVEQGWSNDGRPASSEGIRFAARQASAAAALVIDMPRFGFPSRDAVLRALGRGSIS